MASSLSSDTLKHLVCGVLQAAEHNDAACLADFFAEDASLDVMLLNGKAPLYQCRCKQEILQKQRAFLAGFNLKNSMYEMVCENNKVSACFFQCLRSKGAFDGAEPTGKLAHFCKSILVTFQDDGLISNVACYYDSGALDFLKTPNDRAEPIPIDALKAKVVDTFEAAKAGDKERFAAGFTKDGFLVNTAFKAVPVWCGTEGLQDNITWLHSAFDFLDYDIHEQIGEGSTIATFVTFHFKHTGVFDGVEATQKLIDIPASVVTAFKPGTTLIHMLKSTWDFNGASMFLQNS